MDSRTNETFVRFQTLNIPALTGIRFIAAVMIMLHHSARPFNANETLDLAVETMGGLAMPLFFTLSGYIMWINYANGFKRGRFFHALAHFFAARIARLAPLYFVVMAIGCLTFSWERVRDAAPALALWPVFLQSFVPHFGSEVTSLVIPTIGHTWSISVEMGLYVLFPTIVLLLVQVRSSQGLLLACAGALALMAGLFAGVAAIVSDRAPSIGLGAFKAWALYSGPLAHVSEFFIGSAAAAGFTRRGSRRSPQSDALTIAVIAALFLAALGNRTITPSYYQPVLIAAMMGLLIYLISIPENVAARFLSTPFILWGGERSYSIYMLHPLIIYGLNNYVSVGPSRLSLVLAIMTVVVATTIALSTLTFLIIENPGRRFLRKLINATPTRQSTFGIGYLVLAAAAISYFAVMRTDYPHHTTRINDLISIRGALDAFRKDNGRYPVTADGGGGLTFYGKGWSTSGRNWLPGLVPTYLSRAPIDPRATEIKNAQYILKSDGMNYKLIALRPEDCRFAINKYPEMSDPLRNTSELCQSYGFWTAGAANW